MPRSRLDVDSSTRLCGLIGDPVAQSPSPAMHNAAFQSTGLNFVYLSFKVPAACLEDAVKGLKAVDALGFNVTIPHKETVAKLVDELDSTSSDIGAVNTVVNEGGRLRGFNTDIEGFTAPLRDREIHVKNRRCMVLGAGGAARAVLTGLVREGCGELIILNRSVNRASKMVSELKGKLDFKAETAPLDDATVRRRIGSVDIVVNTTPVGMYPNVDASPVPKGLIRREQVVYDTVYKPVKTKLIEYAEAAGAVVIPGYEMLVGQAARSFTLWTGVDAPRDVMRRTVLKTLGAR